MAELFANGARGRLLNGITVGATSLTLRSGQGALFPAFGVGDTAWAVLEEGSALNPTKREIIQITARSGDSLTVVRAQQGTTALAFNTGSRCEIRLTARTYADLQDAMGFDRRFPQGSATPEGTATVNMTGCFDGTNVASVTRPIPVGNSFLGLSQPRCTGIRLFAPNGATPTMNAIGVTGQAPDVGGVELLIRFVLDTNTSGARRILGVSNSLSATLLSTGPTNPSALVSTAFVALAHDNTDISSDSWKIMRNAGTGGPVTQVSTGISKVIGHLYQLRLWSPRGIAKWYAELIDYDAGSRFFEGYTTNLPPSAATMYPTGHTFASPATDNISLVGAWAFPW